MSKVPQVPQTVTDLFPSKWLHAADLGKLVTVEIASTEFESVYDQRSREHVLKLVVGFVGAKKRLIPNKTQCEALWAITGSERFSDWAGHTVTLAPGQAHNGKQTIVISRPANGNAQPTTPDEPMPQAQPVQAAMADIEAEDEEDGADEEADEEEDEEYYASENADNEYSHVYRGDALR